MTAHFQPSDIEFPTYNEIHLAVIAMMVEVAQRLQENQPAVIISLARGGLIPGVIASHATGIPMVPATYSSKKGAGDDKNHNNVLPLLEHIAPASTIVLIDDIADTGHTIAEVAYHYEHRFDIVTITLYHKESSVFKPDLFWVSIPSDAPFIFFPWEVV